MLGRGRFVGRTKKSTERGRAGYHRGPTWLVCVAVGSENVGDGLRDWSGPQMPTEEVALCPESSGEPFRGFSQESDMITCAF